MSDLRRVTKFQKLQPGGEGGKGGQVGVGGNTEVRVQGSISVSRLRAKVFRALTRVRLVLLLPQGRSGSPHFHFTRKHHRNAKCRLDPETAIRSKCTGRRH